MLELEANRQFGKTTNMSHGSSKWRPLGQRWGWCRNGHQHAADPRVIETVAVLAAMGVVLKWAPVGH